MSFYIRGTRQIFLNILIFSRFINETIKRFGFFSGIRKIWLYLHQKNMLFKDLPDRYIKKAGFVYVVPDVPPVNTKDFIKYLVDDIAIQLDKKPAPLLFSIVCISSVCPYKCSYCYNISTHSTAQLLSVDTINQTIEGLLALGAKNIYLSGGEPMMRFELVTDILERFSKKGLGFWLITTGWGLNNEKAVILKEKGLRGVMISLDGTDAEQINRIKARNAFENAVAAIKVASGAGLLVVADCVVNKELLKEENFENYIRFAGSIGVDFVNLYVPRIYKDMENEKLSNLSIVELKQIADLARKNQSLKNYAHLPLAYSPDEFESRRGCLGGTVFFYVAPDGSVKPCPFKEKILGNIREKNIKEIIDEYRQSGEKEICAVNKLLSGAD